MKKLFLTSAIGTPGVAASIRARLGHDRPLKTAFITTPIEVEDMTDDEWYRTDRAALKATGFDFFDYSVTGKTKAQLEADLQGIEVLYISGGNTNHLLQESRKSGFVDFVRKYVDGGGLYLSTSAGSIIAGPSIPPYLWGDEKAVPELKDFDSYKLVNFTVIPHWGSQWFHDAYLGGRMEQIYSDDLPPYILINDHQYLEVRDDWYRIVDVTKQ